MIDHLTQALPMVALIAAVCAFLGWSMRGMARKTPPEKFAKSTTAQEKGQQDRAKHLEAALEKSKAAHKSLKAELESLQAASVSQATYDSAVAGQETARGELETATKRAAALEADLKKSQETIRHLNSRTNEADKAQKSRTFSLENELSKAREQLALLQDRPDDSAALNEEIQRLRDSVATSTRFAGEMRKREAAAIEAQEKAEARVAELSDPSRAPAASRKLGPVADSGRIAAAKAEVLRLVEMNKQRAEAEIPVAAAVAIPAEDGPQVVERPATGELFNLD